MQAPEDQFSKYAYVFSHRAKEIADRVGADAGGLLLGHLIAHEIGHLLLGPDRHSSTGIMRPKWSRKDAKVASSGELLFTRAQGRRIRAQVLKRMRAEQDQQRTQPDFECVDGQLLERNLSWRERDLSEVQMAVRAY